MSGAEVGYGIDDINDRDQLSIVNVVIEDSSIPCTFHIFPSSKKIPIGNNTCRCFQDKFS